MEVLQDSTVSIYFIPDSRLFGVPGVQVTEMVGVPMLVVAETPFLGLSQGLKRMMDIVLSIVLLIRRTSLDELPQFFNVLQGSMSIVGPRPHASQHNELYRKLIPGYMLRHKVKPGITGWAQVNGLRGETETVEKMRRRIQYDLVYISHWSFAFDLRIILRTALLVFKDSKAY
ncbi:MAG: sugar transferase [Betaproteobacteria bacterium]|nr:sugar transferase [Betaproteobacteria bacterium]